MNMFYHFHNSKEVKMKRTKKPSLIQKEGCSERVNINDFLYLFILLKFSIEQVSNITKISNIVWKIPPLGSYGLENKEKCLSH